MHTNLYWKSNEVTTFHITGNLQEFTCNDRIMLQNPGPSGSVITFEPDNKWHYWKPQGGIGGDPCDIDRRDKYYANHESQTLAIPRGDWNYVNNLAKDLNLTCMDP